MPSYCLDSNVFIQAKNGPYGMDIVPSFWTLLDSQAASGSICCALMVYDELVAGNDELAAWAKQRRNSGFFLAPSATTQAVLSQIAVHVQGNYPSHQARAFLAGADPWVVAQAKAEGQIVVTHERLVTPASRKPKIPNICQVFQVDWIDTYKMLRDLGARF